MIFSVKKDYTNANSASNIRIKEQSVSRNIRSTIKAISGSNQYSSIDASRKRGKGSVRSASAMSQRSSSHKAFHEVLDPRSKRFSSLKKNTAITDTPISPSGGIDIIMKKVVASPFND